ncbi:hypothetical protein F4782DRAFT_494191 [Xylaria castorea]|nr:hypothetical protein F4782DRAFT_494191 [Xylaria castorea]
MPMQFYKYVRIIGKIFDLVVIRSRLREMQPVQASLQLAFERLPTADLGILGRLPENLCRWSSTSSAFVLFYFRQANRPARIISTGLWEYNPVSRHRLESLRGVLRAELAPYLTISDLYRTLITDKCSTCGAFGGHLFFFTAERCCLDCFLFSAYYRVLAPSTFAKLANISLCRLNHLAGQRLHCRLVLSL